MLTPTSWHELTPTQVYAIAPLLLGEPTIANQYQLFEAICPEGILSAIEELNEEELSLLLWQEEISEWWERAITEPIIPIIEHEQQAYQLPNPKFRCMVMVEYDFLETYYHEMTATGNYEGLPVKPEIITKLIAAMCRPTRPYAETQAADYDGEPRQKFNPETIAARAKAMQTLPIGIQAYCLLFFVGCRNFIANTYTSIFQKKDIDVENRLERFRAKNANPYGWKGVMFDLAETGLFGKFVETQYTSMHTILYYLQKKQADAREASKQ